MTETPQVTTWPEAAPPTEPALRQKLDEEGLSAYTWSNGPRDVYSAHSHTYDKVIYVVRGSIVFGLPELGQELSLTAGDRLDLPARVVHNAVVGPEGVVCLEAHK